MPKKSFHLLPVPKSFELRAGCLRWNSVKQVVVPEEFPDVAKQIDRLCAKLQINPQRIFSRDNRLVFGACSTDSAGLVNDNPEAYSLQIEPEGLAINAGSERGALHALRTLKQLIETSPGSLPCLTIKDYPDITRRGYHLDCKAGLPVMDDLYAFVDRLARWKINTLLIEYEDRFPFRCASEITLPGSPSLKEWDDLLCHCRGMGMEIIPLMQTHGHLEYLLKHDRFADLRENGNISEICPSNPAAVNLIRTMLDEVLALHAPDGSFHIGADETWHLASCPHCRARIDKGATELDIFCEQALAMHEFLRERGKRVLMWCDMFWRGSKPEMVNRLPKDIVLCEWIYTRPTARGSPGMIWNGKTHYSARYCERHPLNPELREACIENIENTENTGTEAREFARKYFRPDPQTGVGRLSAHAEYFMEQGYQVIGVGAARAGQGDWLFGQANIIDRLNNIANWADYAADGRVHGVIISSWSRANGIRPPYSPWLSALDAMVAAAQYLWTPATDFKSLVKTAGFNLFGADVTSELGAIYRYMGVHNKYTQHKIRRMEPKIRRGHSHLALLQLWCEFDMFRAETCGQLLKVEKSLASLTAGRLPLHGDRYGAVVLRETAGNVARQCADWRARFGRELTPYFRQEELDEYVDSRIDNLEFRTRNLLIELDKYCKN